MNADDITPITISEVMKMTGRSKRTIDRWIKDGHVHPVDLGGFNGLTFDRTEVAHAEKAARDARRAGRPPKRQPDNPPS